MIIMKVNNRLLSNLLRTYNNVLPLTCSNAHIRCHDINIQIWERCLILMSNRSGIAALEYLPFTQFVFLVPF